MIIKKEYKNIEYDGRVLNFHFKAYQEGFGDIPGFNLYDSDVFVNDKGVKGCHTLNEGQLEKLVKEQEAKKNVG